MRSPTMILLLRAAVVAATAAISVVSFADGDALFGAIFAVMSIANVVMIVFFWRRWQTSGATQDPE